MGTAEPPADSARISADLPCAVCRYNLRSLPHDGRCPECGQPVAQSMQAQWLVFAPPKWVRRVARGVERVLTSVIVLIGGWMVVALGYMLLLGVSNQGWVSSAAPRIWLAAAYAVLAVLFLVPALLGLADLSSTEPSLPKVRARSRWVCVALRVMIWIVPIPPLLGLTEFVAELVPRLDMSAARWLASIGARAAGMIAFVVPVLILLRLRQVTRRTTHQRVDRGLLYVLVIATLAAVLITNGLLFEARRPMGGGGLTPMAARRLATVPYAGGVEVPQAPAAPLSATLPPRMGDWWRSSAALGLVTGRWLGVIAVVYGMALLVRARRVLLETADAAVDSVRVAPS